MTLILSTLMEIDHSTYPRETHDSVPSLLDDEYKLTPALLSLHCSRTLN